jgi:hypothetical protein
MVRHGYVLPLMKMMWFNRRRAFGTRTVGRSHEVAHRFGAPLLGGSRLGASVAFDHGYVNDLENGA